MPQLLRPLRLIGLAAIAALGFFTPTAFAGQMEDCANLQNPENAVLACSAMIDGKTVPAGTEAKVLANRAIAYGRMSQIDPAIADYTAVLKLDQKYPGARYGRAAAFQAKGQFARALTDYNAAITALDPADPKVAKAINGRGTVYARLGKGKLAIADFTKVIELMPELASPHQERGLVYLAKKQFDLAIADFSAALTLSPPTREAYLGRADALAAKKDFNGAIADYSAALAISDKDAAALRGRASAHLNAGRAADALTDIERAMLLEPADKAGLKLAKRIKAAAVKTAKAKKA